MKPRWGLRDARRSVRQWWCGFRHRHPERTGPFELHTIDGIYNLVTLFSECRRCGQARYSAGKYRRADKQDAKALVPKLKAALWEKFGEVR